MSEQLVCLMMSNRNSIIIVIIIELVLVLMKCSYGVIII
jgi:hypothetical protein